MKKLLPISLLFVLLVYACSTVKQVSPELRKESADIAFEYTAITRGAYNKVIVKQDTVITIKNRTMTDAIVKKADAKSWDELLSLLGKVNLDSLSGYKAPTNKRQVDAALSANLKILRKGNTYQTTTFDHGYPPEQIKELTDKIVAISDLNKSGTK